LGGVWRGRDSPPPPPSTPSPPDQPQGQGEEPAEDFDLAPDNVTNHPAMEGVDDSDGASDHGFNNVVPTSNHTSDEGSGRSNGLTFVRADQERMRRIPAAVARASLEITKKTMVCMSAASNLFTA